MSNLVKRTVADIELTDRGNELVIIDTLSGEILPCVTPQSEAYRQYKSNVINCLTPLDKGVVVTLFTLAKEAELKAQEATLMNLVVKAKDDEIVRQNDIIHKLLDGQRQPNSYYFGLAIALIGTILISTYGVFFVASSQIRQQPNYQRTSL